MSLTINSQQVVEIANGIDRQNKKLEQQLKESNATISNLKNAWTGGAAEETYASFKAFSEKYSVIYFETLNNYVRYLKENVAAGYDEAEKVNTDLSDLFK